MWLRFTVASLLIVISTAAATSIDVLDYLGGIAKALAHNGRLSKVDRFLAHGYSGGPQTILLIGSDHRPNSSTSKNGLSDTVLLVRLDPSQSTINMLSIPRDLKVEIPGYGIGKFNAAYSDGGPELSLRTLKQVTGLSVNHLFVIDFQGFAKAVDAIGCVYVDVDRRYYHSNEGLAPSEQYSEINIEPGYQKLCGTRALEFVRYRHTDTDLVREARQQQFLRDARQMVTTEQLIDQRSQLIDIFTKYTTSDLHSTEQLLELLKLFVELRNDSIKQIPFPAILEPVVENRPNYVTASPAAIDHVVRLFLGMQRTDGGKRIASPGGREHREVRSSKEAFCGPGSRPRRISSMRPKAAPRWRRKPKAASASQSFIRRCFRSARAMRNPREPMGCAIRAVIATAPTKWSWNYPAAPTPPTSAYKESAAGPTLRSSAGQANP